MANKKKPRISAGKKRKTSPQRARSKARAVKAEDVVEEKVIETKTSSSPLSNEFQFPDRQQVPERVEDSGDLQGLNTEEVADSESVAELVDEGQAFEGSVVEGVEDAPDPDQSEVRVHKPPAFGRPRPFKDRNSL